MRTKICTWLYIVVVVMSCTSATYAETSLVSGQVVANGGVTHYIYTVTNVLSSGQYIYELGNIILPDGNILPLGHSEPVGWDYYSGREVSSGVILGGEFLWSTGGNMLAPGQSAVFEVYTSSSVTTQWTTNWNIGVHPVGGRNYGYSDGTSLPIPVPVPEPSPILALAGGIAGLGGLALRRRPR